MKSFTYVGLSNNIDENFIQKSTQNGMFSFCVMKCGYSGISCEKKSISFPQIPPMIKKNFSIMA